MIRRLLSFLLLCTAISKSYSQTHTYQFNNTLTGTGPALTQVVDAIPANGCNPAGVVGSFVNQAINISTGTGSSQPVLQFNANGGIQYANPSFITGTYTINVLYKIDDYASGMFGFEKVVDFTNASSDDGLYSQTNGAGTGTLVIVTGNPSPSVTTTIPVTLNAGQFYLITLVRDNGTGLLDVYVDGAIKQSAYNDAAGDFLLPTNTTPVVFFRDDINATYPCESGSGAVRYLSITNAAQDATQVQTTWLSLSAAVLPINLTNFSAQKNTNSITVQWQTSNEYNAAYYNVERSNDAQNFTSIATVNAKNASSNSYVYNDLSGISLTNSYTYYRLKSVDANGNFKYSSIVKIANGKETKITLFPNPVTNFVTISGLNSKDEIRLLSIDGKVLSQQTNTGAQSMIMNVEKYTPGTYIIQVKNDTEVSQQKFVKY